MNEESMKSNRVKKVISENRREFIKNKLMATVALLFGASKSSFGGRLSTAYQDKKEAILVDNEGNVDWTAVKAQFTLPANRHHFNTASLGPSPRPVIDKLITSIEFLEKFGAEDLNFVRPAREKLANFFNIEPEQLGITRNTTEGVNIVARSLKLKTGDEVILSTDEHIGGAAPWIAIQKELDITIKLIELDPTGKDNFNIIKNSITTKTKVVVLSHVTCVTGMLLPVKKIAKLCRKKGVISCIDGAQAVGMIPVDIADINPDFYVGSGHKWMYGPKGTGFIYMNKEYLNTYSPHYVGTYSDSKFDLSTLTLEYLKTASRVEYGTRNAPVIASFGAAVDFLTAIGMDNVTIRGKFLAKYFREKLEEDQTIEVFTPKDDKCYASIITFKKKSVSSAQVCQRLINEKETMVLRHIYEKDLDAIRVSFPVHTVVEEVDLLLATLKNL